MNDRIKAAIKRAEEYERRGVFAPGDHEANAILSARQAERDELQRQALEEHEKRKGVFVIDGREYPQSAECNGSAIQMERDTTCFGDHRYTATIDSTWRTSDTFNHPEAARQEAESAIRHMEDMLNRRDAMKAQLEGLYPGDPESVKALLENAFSVRDIIGTRVERI